MRIMVSILATALCFSLPARGQTLDETLAFIGKKLAGYRSYKAPNATWEEHTAIRFDGCAAVYTERYIWSTGGDYTAVAEFDLKSLDPTRITTITEGRLVRFETFESRKVIKYTNASGEVEYKDWWRLWPWENNERAGRQLLQALTHAVNVCGGKSELFPG